MTVCWAASPTPQEPGALALAASGLLNRQVGLRLGMGEITVKTHRGRVMQKMMADSLADLVKTAESGGVESRLAPFTPCRWSPSVYNISPTLAVRHDGTAINTHRERRVT